MVVEEPEYTLWGWILLSMFGITPKPDHVVYRCQICRMSLGSTRNPKVLERRMKQRQGVQESAAQGTKEPRGTQGDEPKEAEGATSEEGSART